MRLFHSAVSIELRSLRSVGTIVPSWNLPIRKDWPVAKSRENRAATLEQAFGQVLFARREKKGLSQMDLAVASGYSLRYIGDVERGTKSATLRTMHDLATLLNVKLATLIVEAEELWANEAKEKRRPIKSIRN
jgi:ribosome-binding protein aMBF1 (putative translation factor)